MVIIITVNGDHHPMTPFSSLLTVYFLWGLVIHISASSSSAFFMVSCHIFRMMMMMIIIIKRPLFVLSYILQRAETVGEVEHIEYIPIFLILRIFIIVVDIVLIFVIINMIQLARSPLSWLTHIEEQQICWCVWRNPTVQFVLSISLSTINWNLCSCIALTSLTKRLPYILFVDPNFDFSVSLPLNFTGGFKKGNFRKPLNFGNKLLDFGNI